MSGTSTTTMGDRGRLVVPAELRRRLGWQSGTRLHFIETDDGVIVMTHNELLAMVRADWQAAGAGVLEELFAERRAAAAADNREILG